MRVTRLYEDTTTNQIKTFDEVKEEYIIVNDSDLPISDDVMHMIILNELVQNGGNIRLIHEHNDELLKWVNDYGDLLEADRYFNQSERDMSARNLYLSIGMNDVDTVTEIKKALADINSKDITEELEKRLKDFLENA